MYFRRFLFAALFPALISGVLHAQTSPSAPNVASLLQPATSETSRALSTLNVRRWKIPGEVKDAMEANVTSIQNDLASTLPGLVTRADAAPGSVPEAFAVYRNLDALYDVLLRVTENANLGAPRDETSGLMAALDSLKQARSSLGEEIVNQAKTQQSQIEHLRTTIANAAKVAAQKPPETVIVDDGPVTAHHRRTHTTTKKKSSSSVSSGSGQNQPHP